MSMSPEQYDAVAARAELLVAGADVERALDRLGKAIALVLRDKDPLVLCVMTGAVIITGCLLPRLRFPLRLDYIHATRYRGSTRGGSLEWRHRPSASIRDQHVLVVDDILDEGVTLDTIVRACHEDGAASVHSAVLVEKVRPRLCDCSADFVGVQVPNRYLFGYGLDYKNYFRNANGIYAVVDEDL